MSVNKKRGFALVVFIVVFILVVLSFLFFRSPSKNNHEVSAVTTSAPTTAPLSITARIPASLPSSKTQAVTTSPIAPTIAAQPAIPLEVAEARSKSKMTLSSAYSALKAFRMEFGRFSTDLRFVGFAPLEYQESEIVKYKIGFLQSFTPNERIEIRNYKENPEALSTDTMVDESNNSDRKARTYSSLAQNVSLNDYAQFCKMDCTASPESFELILVYPLEGHGNDIWLINDKKEPILACDGLLNDC